MKLRGVGGIQNELGEGYGIEIINAVLIISKTDKCKNVNSSKLCINVYVDIHK